MAQRSNARRAQAHDGDPPPSEVARALEGLPVFPLLPPWGRGDHSRLPLRLGLAGLQLLARLGVQPRLKSAVLLTMGVGGALGAGVAIATMRSATVTLVLVAAFALVAWARRHLRFLLDVDGLLSARSVWDAALAAAFWFSPLAIVLFVVFGGELPSRASLLIEPAHGGLLMSILAATGLEGLSRQIRSSCGARESVLAEEVEEDGASPALQRLTRIVYGLAGDLKEGVGPIDIAATELQTSGNFLVAALRIVWLRCVRQAGRWLESWGWYRSPAGRDLEVTKLHCRLLFRRRQFDRVLEEVEASKTRLARSCTRRSDVLVCLEALAMFRLQRAREALSRLEASEGATDNVYTLRSRAYLEWSLGNDEAARELNRRVLELDPSCPLALRDEAWALLEGAALCRRRGAGTDHAALRAAQQLLADAVLMASARIGRVPGACLYALGVLKALQNQRDDARKLFVSGIRLEKDPGCRLGLAALLLPGTTTFSRSRFQLHALVHAANRNLDDRLVRSAAQMLRWIDIAQDRGASLSEESMWWFVGPEAGPAALAPPRRLLCSEAIDRRALTLGAPELLGEAWRHSRLSLERKRRASEPSLLAPELLATAIRSASLARAQAAKPRSRDHLALRR